jgi:dTMP kinase
MGRLIVFEGIDGVGKATQTALLVKRLRAAGRRATVFTSPRYDLPTGRLVGRALSGEFGDFVKLSPYLSALPYMLDFAAWRSDVESALKRGDVICDRYVYSTLAYASAKLTGEKRKKFLSEMGHIAFNVLELPRADIVLLLDVPVAVSQQLMKQKKKDQYESNLPYQRKVAAVYASLSRGRAWKVVRCASRDKMLSRGVIAESVWKAVR